MNWSFLIEKIINLEKNKLSSLQHKLHDKNNSLESIEYLKNEIKKKSRFIKFLLIAT